MKKRNWLGALLSILIAEAAGVLGAFLSGSIQQSYQNFILPPLAPPPWLFGLVWPVLYALMGLAVYLVSTSNGLGRDIDRAVKLYTVQLAVNVLWPVVFFRFDRLWAAAAVILLLDVLVFLTLKAFYKVSEGAAKLMIPYFLWICFATYLNVAIAALN